jgi:predicted nucleic acid-binding protein
LRSRSGANASDRLTLGAPVVSNTTPLIILGELGLIEALQSLYTEIWAPETVLAEYECGRASHPLRPQLTPLSWMHSQVAPVAPHVPSSLDEGERDAIALALSLHASRILLDERAARGYDARMGLTVTGSIGVLLAAKRCGIITLVKPYLDMMIDQGRYISPTLIDQILRQAGE